MKRFFVFAVLALLVGQANAQWVVANPSAHNGKLAMEQPTGPENDLVLMPTASMGFAPSSAVPSYGFNVAYDLIVGQIAPNGTNVNITPFLGIGGGIFFDLGPTLNSNFGQPVLVDVEVNVIGPMIEGVVPGVMKTWNLDTGEQKILVNANVPFGLFSASSITKVHQF